MTGPNVVIKKKNRARVTYSDLPIQVAERSLSRLEFIEEVSKDANNTIFEILTRLNCFLNRQSDLSDDQYSYNEIVNRGTVTLEFDRVHQLVAQLTGLFSMQQLKAKVISEHKVSFEVRAQDHELSFDNLQGAFVRVIDRGRSYRAEITNVVVQDTVDGGVILLIDCTYFPTKSGNSRVLNMMIRVESKNLMEQSPNTSSKKQSMKKFRQSYVDLESIGTSSGQKNKNLRTSDALKSWIKKFVIDRFKS